MRAACNPLLRKVHSPAFARVHLSGVTREVVRGFLGTPRGPYPMCRCTLVSSQLFIPDEVPQLPPTLPVTADARGQVLTVEIAGSESFVKGVADVLSLEPTVELCGHLQLTSAVRAALSGRPAVPVVTLSQSSLATTEHMLRVLHLQDGSVAKVQSALRRLIFSTDQKPEGNVKAS